MQKKTNIQLHIYEFKFNIKIFLINFIYIFLICSIFIDQLIYILIKPLLQSKTLIYLINIFIIQFWFFFSEGFFKKENIQFIKIYFYFNILNIFIIYLIIIKILPYIWILLINETFNNNYLINIYFEPKFEHYFTFFISFFISFYFCFLYFILLFCFLYFKLFKLKKLIFFRKFFYLKFLIINILFNSYDFLIQLLLIILLIIFFELLIYLYFYIKKYYY